MRIIQIGSRFIIGVVTVSLFFTACSSHKEKVVVKEEKKAIVKTIEIKKSDDQNKTSIVKLTPIQKCKKEKDSYNLIVDVPFNARVRILNIKPVYRDCIPLKKGKYHIEVTKIGFKKYKKWIYLDSDTALDVKLKKIKIIDRSKEEKYELKKAGFNKKALQKFVKKYPKSDRALIAKNRIGIIKKKFRGYSPNGLIRSNNCIGFYPKELVEKNLTISTSIDYWDSMRWSGSCKNSLMSGRGVIYFKADNGVSVELKGKMKNGFFNGKVYNYSKSKEEASYIKNSGRGNYIVKLKNRFDFKHYQE
ncbi:hypothetical protein [Sulfurimonas sp.]|uniref:hypothetical protein n=1 Tax=Sulfurimonas sp. TaxID=2022749 RepID=UPI002637A5D5|nr:hypothetical protein [Sulfurimonas sp.]MCW8895223.1 hypothetical protein [Sulfurimonas sp.]MCW9068264.1 hypothetical protein [Sulfurimonas sp.]